MIQTISLFLNRSLLRLLQWQIQASQGNDIFNDGSVGRGCELDAQLGVIERRMRELGMVP